MTLFYSPSRGGPLLEKPLDSLRQLVSSQGWFWLDILGSDAEAIESIAAVLGFHEVDIEDVLQPTEYPKLEERAGYSFLIAHTPSLDDERLRTIEIDFFLGTNYLVTIRTEDSPGFGVLKRMVGQDSAAAPDILMATAVEMIGRRMLPLLTGLDELITSLEDQALAGDPMVPQHVQALRRDTIQLRRLVVPQRDAQKALAANRAFVTSESARARFMSAYDDYSRIADSLETARSLLASILETYRATVAERMNEVMKVLTVFSAIVLPLGLMAGIYGMNFSNMPALQTRWGFVALIAVMLATAVGLWLYFASRGFVGGPKLPRVDRVVAKGLAGFVHLTLSPVRMLERALHEPAADDSGETENTNPRSTGATP